MVILHVDVIRKYLDVCFSAIINIRRNGDIYRGMWQDNKKHGEGEFIADNGKGDTFKGTFENDNKEYGRYVFSDGDIYEGGYENDQQEGQGRCSL